MDRWPSGITGILKATTFFFTFGYRFLLFILFFFLLELLFWFDFVSVCPLQNWPLRVSGRFPSQYSLCCLAGHTYTKSLYLSPSLSLSLSLSLSFSLYLSVCLSISLSIPLFFSSFLSIYFFVEERPSGDSNYQGTAQLIYHRFIESLLENNSRLNVVPI